MTSAAPGPVWTSCRVPLAITLPPPKSNRTRASAGTQPVQVMNAALAEYDPGRVEELKVLHEFFLHLLHHLPQERGKIGRLARGDQIASTTTSRSS